MLEFTPQNSDVNMCQGFKIWKPILLTPWHVSVEKSHFMKNVHSNFGSKHINRCRRLSEMLTRIHKMSKAIRKSWFIDIDFEYWFSAQKNKNGFLNTHRPKWCRLVLGYHLSLVNDEPGFHYGPNAPNSAKIGVFGKFGQKAH